MDEEVMIAPAVGQKISATEAMSLAILEGHRGAGFVAPNPLVGCVIADREHRFLASGFHARLGGDHAEIDALKKLKGPQALAGCHVYVTLEPCAHEGRTPSCAKTLAPLKPASVTYAVEDPNPLVAGKGAQILRKSGVDVRLWSELTDVSKEDRDRLTNQAEELAEIFLHNQRAKLPFVAVKVATSLDGQMAMSSGESKWITGEKAREHVHALRAHYDAVLVGRNTFEKDDPSLNVRHPNFPGFRNRAIVLDPVGKIFGALQGSNLLRSHAAQDVIVVTRPDVETTSIDVKHLRVKIDSSGSFDVPDLLAALRAEDVTSILVEGGAQTYGALFRAQAVQRLHIYIAPTLIGGQHAISWSSHFGGEKMTERLHLEDVKREDLGADLYWTARLMA